MLYPCNGILLRRKLKKKISETFTIIKGFPGSSAGKRICLQCRRSQFDPCTAKTPWRRVWQQPTPVFLSGESPWTEEPGGLQSTGRTESDTTGWLSTHSTALTIIESQKHYSKGKKSSTKDYILNDFHLYKSLEKAKLYWRTTDGQVIRGERRLSAKLWHSKLMSVMATLYTLQGSNTDVFICQAHWTVHLNLVTSIACKLYLNKADCKQNHWSLKGKVIQWLRTWALSQNICI